MEAFHAWWITVPDWARPVLLAFALPTALASLIWIFAKGLPTVRRQFNIWILERLERTETRIKEREHVRPESLEERVEKESGLPLWLVKRARQWLKRRNKYGL
jgi:hypothetical protein